MGEFPENWGENDGILLRTIFQDRKREKLIFYFEESKNRNVSLVEKHFFKNCVIQIVLLQKREKPKEKKQNIFLFSKLLKNYIITIFYYT